MPLPQPTDPRSSSSDASFETPPLKTSFIFVTRFKILGLGTLLLWIPCAVLSWNSPTGGPVVGSVFLFFAALGILLAFLDKRYEVDERGVRSFWFSQKEELKWEEIRRVGYVQKQASLLFMSDEHAIELAGFTQWKDRELLMQFIEAKMRRYNIEWQPNLLPAERKNFATRKPTP